MHMYNIYRQYRRQCLGHTTTNLNLELDFLDIFAEQNPKNYQIWHHRRCIVEILSDGNREKMFCDIVLLDDSKNYHCWAHR